MTRWLGFWAAFACAALLTGAGLERGADALRLPQLAAPLDALPPLHAKIAAAQRPAGGLVVFLGDSLAIDARAPDTSIPVQLERELALRAGDAAAPGVLALTGPAFSVFSHYFLSECVAGLPADAVVVALNPRSFSSAWLAEERGELAGWLPARRWVEALRLPLEAVGVSLDSLVFSHALVWLGGFDLWHRLQRQQVRLAWGPRELAQRLQRLAWGETGMALHTVHERARLRREKTVTFRATPWAVSAHLGPLLRGLEPAPAGLALLDALLGRLADTGAAVLVYLAPVNVEQLEKLGLRDRERIERSASRIGALARQRGAQFLDLHALLPDAAFRDHLDHLNHGVPDEGSARVARQLARSLPPLAPERLAAPGGAGIMPPPCRP